MDETGNEKRQAQVELLWRLREQGILSEAAYQEQLAALGVDLEALTGEADGGAARPGTGTTYFTHIEHAYGTGIGDGAQVTLGEPEAESLTASDADHMVRYLAYVIAQNRYLPLQGIHSGGRLVSIELEQIYVTLRTARRRTARDQDAWLAAEADLAPGEAHRHRLDQESKTAPRAQAETFTVSVHEALAAYPRLVVLGDPGSGKTTLLRYLALLYARDLYEDKSLVGERLSLDESGYLPILLPLRRLGAYLEVHHPVDDGTEGHKLLLDHLFDMLAGERVVLPEGFFDPYLAEGQAVILLDGLDEVADPALRRRVSRLVEALTAAYPDCRYVVTSRVVGYVGAARLVQDYVTTMVRDFTQADMARFLHNWHLAVAVGQRGPGESAEAYAVAQTSQLLDAIVANGRVRELAINPLMLTVIALVHRERVKLPDRRAELYAEAVDVLLGKWDEARGVQETAILPDRAFDAGDKRLLLQQVALEMHSRRQKEVSAEDLRRLIGAYLYEQIKDWREASRAVDRFLRVIQERTGLLIGRGQGVYAFSHLTFQEYLAALAVAAREDYVAYTLKHCADPWWREVILLQAGYLSTQSRQRTTHLISAIADCGQEKEPYHNLVLAAECLHDVGATRVEGDLLERIVRRLRSEFEHPLRVKETKAASQENKKWWQRWGTPMLSAGAQSTEPAVRLPDLIRRRAAAAEALTKIESGAPGTQPAFWRMPHGIPVWVEVPGGEFWMGGERYEDERPVHRVHVETFYMARVPVTNAQYCLFVEATGHGAPGHWEGDRVPRGLESHPVVNVSWHDALAYCRWLEEKLREGGYRVHVLRDGRLEVMRLDPETFAVDLPSEAQWEKAAQGDQDRRAYPWGDEWDETRCNTDELGLGGTTPVGIFPEGQSMYGCLDMAGNVWEWTKSLWGRNSSTPKFRYPYDAGDGREDLEADDEVARVLRGGSFDNVRDRARCSSRGRGVPYSAIGITLGFVVWSPPSLDLCPLPARSAGSVLWTLIEPGMRTWIVQQDRNKRTMWQSDWTVETTGVKDGATVA